MTHTVTVGVDADDTIADLWPHLLDEVNRFLGTAYSHEDLPEWDVVSLVPAHQRTAFWESFAVRMAGHYDLQPCPGAVEGIQNLQAVAEVYVITAYPTSAPTWTYDRNAWLDRYFGIAPSHVVHTSAKHLVRVDIFVDDRPSNVRAWQAAHPTGTGVLWATAANAKFAHECAVRTGSWDDVVEIVRARR